jgi:hypothetical protein
MLILMISIPIPLISLLLIVFCWCSPSSSSCLSLFALVSHLVLLVLPTSPHRIVKTQQPATAAAFNDDMSRVLEYDDKEEQQQKE